METRRGAAIHVSCPCYQGGGLSHRYAFVLCCFAQGIPGVTMAGELTMAGEVSLLFAPGARPDAGAVAALLAAPAGEQVQPARISHRGDAVEGRLELLASGLTFDLSGLSPASPALLPPVSHLYGLDTAVAGSALEAITLAPGEHVAAGRALVPVVRVMAGLAARLAGLSGVAAIAWQPARTWVEPAFFARVVAAWLAGGAFPALGLTALDRTADGGVESTGLAWFTGQEMRLEPLAGEEAAATVKIAMRLIDALVAHGRLAGPQSFAGPDGSLLLAEPDPGGSLVRVWRKG